MTRVTRLGIYLVVAIAQCAVPAWMITQRERVLEQGTAYLFKTAPIDPYDPFRGRYVQLNFLGTEVPYLGEGDPPWNVEVYAPISVGEDGFAVLIGADLHPPASGDYLRAHSVYWGEDKLMHLTLPFERYYMNEAAAPEAERAVREGSLAPNSDVYVSVRVLNGHAVLEQLYVSGVPIEEFLRQAPNSP